LLPSLLIPQIQALRELNRFGLKQPSVNAKYDCLSAEKLVTLPGLIDIHAYLRGGVSAADVNLWTSYSREAVSGGFTMLLASSDDGITDQRAFEALESVASQGTHCDYGLYLTATSRNTSIGSEIGENCAGLEMDLSSENHLDSLFDWIEHMRQFPTDRPVVCYAQGRSLAAVLTASRIADRPGIC
jgi:dihydroorotase-like cyclic amidohydrolase